MRPIFGNIDNGQYWNRNTKKLNSPKYEMTPRVSMVLGYHDLFTINIPSPKYMRLHRGNHLTMPFERKPA